MGEGLGLQLNAHELEGLTLGFVDRHRPVVEC